MFAHAGETRAGRMRFSNQKLNKSRGSEVERLVTFFTIMKKILFALSMLALVVSALPRAARADVSVDFFYNNLSGGNWIEVEGYGYGWQPDVAVSDPTWRPYADDGWVLFAGGDLDWGPAGVSWRTGGDYFGWAPLPPRGLGIVYGGQLIGA